MTINTNSEFKCSEIVEILKTKNPDELWVNYSGWVKTLVPFWKTAILTIATQIDFDKTKTAKHITAVENAFDFMDKWRFNKIKYVKARRNEIDSAISFIRNNALNRKVYEFLYAPICRNVASILRGCLYISTHGYHDNQMPILIAQDIYELASIRMLLPLDSAALVSFLPKGKSIHTGDNKDIDNYNLMFDSAAKELNMTDRLNQINQMALEIWNNFDKPQEWTIPKEFWHIKTDGISQKLHYENMASFHKK